MKIFALKNCFEPDNEFLIHWPLNMLYYYLLINTDFLKNTCILVKEKHHMNCRAYGIVSSEIVEAVL